jgi:hypothetical protein
MSIVHQDLVNRVASLIAALQHYVTVNTDTGLNDVCSSLEILISEMLQITEDLNLTRLNLFQSNFPAIDLADSKRGIAVQVTSNVTSAKWKDTVAKFAAHGLNAHYTQLRIIGFCKAVKPRALPAHVTVQGPQAFLAGLKSLDVAQLTKLESLLRTSYDFSKLNPLHDKDCFLVVLRVLDRDALRHFTIVEGSYTDFSHALKEIKEVINAGSIPSKGIYAKPLSQYSSPYEALLSNVDLQLSQMLAEVNRARQGHNYCLTYQQKQMIDRSRSSIIQEVNDFCKGQGIAHEIRGIW